MTTLSNDNNVQALNLFNIENVCSNVKIVILLSSIPVIYFNLTAPSNCCCDVTGSSLEITSCGDIAACTRYLIYNINAANFLLRMQYVSKSGLWCFDSFTVRCRLSQFARCFLPAQTCLWNDLPYSVWHRNIRWVEGSSQSLVAPLSLFFCSWCRRLWGFISNF